jgi:TetR/AcrR family transcriptional repressor of nem operon
MVGRPRQFDIDQVLDAAMAAFWAKGYEATSLSDLMTATGLHKGSLYQAFGDKHSLFVQALKRYLQSMRSAKDEILATAVSPLDGLRRVTHRMVEFIDDSDCPMGCMAINALVEMAPHDDEVRAVVFDHISRMRRSLYEAVCQAQSAGEIDSKRPPEVVTALLMTTMAGLATTIKGPISKAEAHQLMDAQIDALV